MVVPHSAAPTIDHESSQLAAPTPIRIGIVRRLEATKKLFMFLLAFPLIKIPTAITPAKYRRISAESKPDHKLRMSTIFFSFLQSAPSKEASGNRAFASVIPFTASKRLRDLCLCGVQSSRADGCAPDCN